MRPLGAVCLHGQLARSCAVCELTEELERVRQERDSLAAQVECQRAALATAKRAAAKLRRAHDEAYAMLAEVRDLVELDCDVDLLAKIDAALGGQA